MLTNKVNGAAAMEEQIMGANEAVAFLGIQKHIYMLNVVVAIFLPSGLENCISSNAPSWSSGWMPREYRGRPIQKRL